MRLFEKFIIYNFQSTLKKEQKKEKELNSIYFRAQLF